MLLLLLLLFFFFLPLPLPAFFFEAHRDPCSSHIFFFCFRNVPPPFEIRFFFQNSKARVTKIITDVVFIYEFTLVHPVFIVLLVEVYFVVLKLLILVLLFEQYLLKIMHSFLQIKVFSITIVHTHVESIIAVKNKSRSVFFFFFFFLLQLFLFFHISIILDKTVNIIITKCFYTVFLG